ncbi:hypothetical protein HBI56_119470 [Parastagonospora nodorum]|uniref:Uncharacterized protein n=1 Tax=Phaeosphaeria nodorum (strain SN15 / ATCC MYA-4574 / FGSC 10173) TaxID=321614 RepID=A0A7U2I5G7_PHANO|nr:hypothetical protein HBH56_055300 [Parastagonospora nodorum]QRD02389.1 hypothetical protein JI435_417900 [Parastagonospora nodorum SN15]KAH3935506.1 hypothetical protein HBH54_041100 [Parastagonospora nodorum]KAH3948779.1 hypothetical protein HBH53_098210 [Parastagonospora nodorum]KAH3970098.1 hypothetical protein HBH51_121240 [Parastagonospora nodorum]
MLDRGVAQRAGTLWPHLPVTSVSLADRSDYLHQRRDLAMSMRITNSGFM